MVKKKTEKKPKEEKKTKKSAKAEVIEVKEKQIVKKVSSKVKEAIAEEPKQLVELPVTKDRYYESVGRRKTA